MGYSISGQKFPFQVMRMWFVHTWLSKMNNIIGIILEYYSMLWDQIQIFNGHIRVPGSPSIFSIASILSCVCDNCLMWR